MHIIPLGWILTYHQFLFEISLIFNQLYYFVKEKPKRELKLTINLIEPKPAAQREEHLPNYIAWGVYKVSSSLIVRHWSCVFMYLRQTHFNQIIVSLSLLPNGLLFSRSHLILLNSYKLLYAYSLLCLSHLKVICSIAKKSSPTISSRQS